MYLTSFRNFILNKRLDSRMSYYRRYKMKKNKGFGLKLFLNGRSSRYSSSRILRRISSKRGMFKTLKSLNSKGYMSYWNKLTKERIKKNV